MKSERPSLTRITKQLRELKESYSKTEKNFYTKQIPHEKQSEKKKFHWNQVKPQDMEKLRNYIRQDKNILLEEFRLLDKEAQNLSPAKRKEFRRIFDETFFPALEAFNAAEKEFDAAQKEYHSYLATKKGEHSYPFIMSRLKEFKKNHSERENNYLKNIPHDTYEEKQGNSWVQKKKFYWSQVSPKDMAQLEKDIDNEKRTLQEAFSELDKEVQNLNLSPSDYNQYIHERDQIFSQLETVEKELGSYRDQEAILKQFKDIKTSFRNMGTDFYRKKFPQTTHSNEKTKIQWDKVTEDMMKLCREELQHKEDDLSSKLKAADATFEKSNPSDSDRKYYKERKNEISAEFQKIKNDMLSLQEEFSLYKISAVTPSGKYKFNGPDEKAYRELKNLESTTQKTIDECEPGDPKLHNLLNLQQEIKQITDDYLKGKIIATPANKQIITNCVQNIVQDFSAGIKAIPEEGIKNIDTRTKLEKTADKFFLWLGDWLGLTHSGKLTKGAAKFGKHASYPPPDTHASLHQKVPIPEKETSEKTVEHKRTMSKTGSL